MRGSPLFLSRGSGELVFSAMSPMNRATAEAIRWLHYQLR